jgi:phosphopantetheinyl transferase
VRCGLGRSTENLGSDVVKCGRDASEARWGCCRAIYPGGEHVPVRRPCHFEPILVYVSRGARRTTIRRSTRLEDLVEFTQEPEPIETIAVYPSRGTTYSRIRSFRLRVDAVYSSRSYAAGLSMIGLSNRRIGVDVERIRPIRRSEAITQLYMGPPAVSALMTQPKWARGIMFLRYWTRLEALAKATGLGLAALLDRRRDLPLTASVVSGIPDPRESTESAWWLGNVSVLPGYVAAIASEQLRA